MASHDVLKAVCVDSNPCQDSDVNNNVINELASSGISVGGLLSFLCELLTGRVMAFDPDVTTTGQVAYQAVIPLSAKHGTSYAHIINGGKACYPELMVSHAWNELFLHLVAAVVAHVTHKQFYFGLLPHLRSAKGVEALMTDMGQATLSKTVWICVFGVNQHVSICRCRCHKVKYANGNPLCQMDKFDQMIAFVHKSRGQDFGQVIVPGKYGCALTRAWVVSEIATCLTLGVGQHAQISFPVTLCNSEMAALVKVLDVEKCQASRPEDKDLILAAIADKNIYNQQVRCLLTQSLNLRTPIVDKSFVAIAVFLTTFAVGLALLVLMFYDNSPFLDRLYLFSVIAILAPLYSYTKLLGYTYDFLFMLLAKADERGLCRAVFEEVPRSPWWSAPRMELHRMMALFSGDVPFRWKRIGQIIGSTAVAILLVACWPLFASSEVRRPVIVLMLLILSACVLDEFGKRMHIVGEVAYNRCFNLFYIVPLLFTHAISIFLMMCVYCVECWNERSLRWDLTPLEKSLCFITILCRVLSVMAERVFAAFTSCKLAIAKNDLPSKVTPIPGDVVLDYDELSSPRKQIQDNVEMWSHTSLRVIDLSADMIECGDSFFGGFGELVGFFPVRDSTMEFSGVAILTYETELDASRAFEELKNSFRVYRVYATAQ